jgi:hypothetical protein
MMATLSNFHIWIFLIHFTTIASQKNDGLCPHIKNILCVNEVLSDILAAAKEIYIIAEKIEQSIVSKYIIDKFF